MEKLYTLIESRIPIIFILLILCISIGKSQVPGYIGKRFYLEFSTKLSPALLLPSQNNNGLNNLRESFDSREVGLALNYSYNCQINYAISRKKSLGVNLSQFYTGQVIKLVVNQGINNGQVIENFHRLNVRTVGLKYDVFNSKKGSIAPVGRFYSLGINAVFVSGEIVDHIANSSIEITESAFNINQNIVTFSFSIGLSKIQMITDQLYFKYGSTFSIPLKYSDINTDSFFITADNNQSIYNDAVYRRILGHEIYNFEIGIGYLIF